MNVSAGPAGRHVRSDLAWRKLRNHNTATTLKASSAPQHQLFSFNSCVMFPPQQTFPCEQMESKKSGKNECIEEKADTMN